MKRLALGGYIYSMTKYICSVWCHIYNAWTWTVDWVLTGCRTCKTNKTFFTNSANFCNFKIIPWSLLINRFYCFTYDLVHGQVNGSFFQGHKSNAIFIFITQDQSLVMRAPFFTSGLRTEHLVHPSISFTRFSLLGYGEAGVQQSLR